MIPTDQMSRSTIDIKSQHINVFIIVPVLWKATRSRSLVTCKLTVHVSNVPEHGLKNRQGPTWTSLLMYDRGGGLWWA